MHIYTTPILLLINQAFGASCHAIARHAMIVIPVVATRVEQGGVTGAYKNILYSPYLLYSFLCSRFIVRLKFKKKSSKSASSSCV